LRRIGRAQKPDDRDEARDRGDLRIGALGDGSDYAPFLDHAGVASLNIGFGGEADGGIYHSIYDDFYWYTHFGDPDFVYEKALSQVGGTAVMRMADADVLLYDPSGSADTISRYVKELKTELKEKQDKVREKNREIEEGVFTASADPTKTYVAPPKEAVPPYLNFAPLENGSEAYTRAAKRYKQAFGRLAESNPTVWDSPELKTINEKLMQTERTFTTAEGLKERPWFKHQIYAPGAYTGYGAKTIPAVREMMEEDKWQDADAGAVIAGAVLMKQAALVDSIAAELEQVVGQAPPATQTAKKHRRAEERQVSGR
jgi:N-acetylated-alpha-linked acidic dipeptidase